MDYLDPRKQRSHMIRLFVGYILIAVAVLIATIILLYQAFGFGLDRKGEVIQNGLLFVSSKPSGARIYIDGKLENNASNTKLQLPGGTYKVELQREGYVTWKRTIALQGGSVEHYDYPMLFPTSLKTANVKTYASLPSLATASPDRRWLIASQANSATGFDLFDLSDPKQVSARLTTIALPDSQVSLPRTGNHTWKLVEWSNDNRRVVLQHMYDGGSEYVLVDRQAPDQSINLTRILQLQPSTALSLRDKKFDKFYLFDAAAKTLASTSLVTNAPRQIELNGVLAFKSYSDDKILYATDIGATAGKVFMMLRDGGNTYKVREITAGDVYLMDVTKYDGNWIVAVGSKADNKVYVYKNPQAVRKNAQQTALVPVHVMKVPAPDFLVFSSNSQLLMVEGGNNFATYDIETERGYGFATKDPIDAPNTHATWMDDHRIIYTSGGKLTVRDYDNANQRTLVAMSPVYLPFFDRDFKNLYTISPGTGTSVQPALTNTSMLTPADQ